MRPAASLWSRAVSRPARRTPPARKWSRETALMLSDVLKTHRQLPWGAVQKYGEMPPQTADALSLLPLLESRALNDENSLGSSGKVLSTRRSVPVDREGLETVGRFAFDLNLVTSLSPHFLATWIRSRAASDAFGAIQIYKATSRIMPLTLGAELYIRAGQFDKAAELMAKLDLVPVKLRKQLIDMGMCTDVPPSALQPWIDSWQAMDPRDLRWLHHVSTQSRRSADLRLPVLPIEQAVPERYLKASEGLQHLVANLNGMLADHPELLSDPELKEAWTQSILEPTQSKLSDLAVHIAERLPAYGFKREAWISVLRALNGAQGRRLLPLLKFEHLPPRLYAIVIARTEGADITAILQEMSPETLYTTECLHALASRHPAAFADLVIPQELLESRLSEHQLMLLWRGVPSRDSDLLTWLFPLTQEFRSPRLLRAALQTLARLGDPHSAEELLVEFAGAKKLALDAKLLNKRAKLGEAKPSSLNEEETKQAVKGIIDKLFGNHGEK